MKNKLKRDMGERLKQVRKVLGLSQRQIAAQLLTSRSTYSQNETGVYIPGASMLYKLLADKGVSLNWLVGGVGDMFDGLAGMDAKIPALLKKNPELAVMLLRIVEEPMLLYKVMETFDSYKKE
ncbi:MAG: helix-turn-helix transcriptional regulator [bacterium]|nr:helix-turn-helix transcriptional regulator [bacterium]